MSLKKISVLGLTLFTLNSCVNASTESVSPYASLNLPEKPPLEGIRSTLPLIDTPIISGSSSPLIRSATYVPVLPVSSLYASLAPSMPSTPISTPVEEILNNNFIPVLSSKIPVLLNGISHSLEINSIIALGSRIVDNSTAKKRKLSPEVFKAIRDDLELVRSILSRGLDVNVATLQPVLEKILKNAITAYHPDVNVMLGKLGLDEGQLTVLKTSLVNAAEQLKQEDPRSLEECVTCLCTQVLLPMAAQLLHA
jgi:hypothetical protein